MACFSVRCAYWSLIVLSAGEAAPDDVEVVGLAGEVVLEGDLDLLVAQPVEQAVSVGQLTPGRR